MHTAPTAWTIAMIAPPMTLATVSICACCQCQSRWSDSEDGKRTHDTTAPMMGDSQALGCTLSSYALGSVIVVFCDRFAVAQVLRLYAASVDK